MQLSAFVNAFRTPDLRKKLLFTLGVLALFRLGSVVPTPGVDYAAVQTCIASVEGNSVYGMINLFSGGGRCCSCRSSPSGSCPTSRPASSCS